MASATASPPPGGGGQPLSQTSSPSKGGDPESTVLIQVSVPELGEEKCLQFAKDEVIWEVKQQVLAALPKELPESFNYGLYMPPNNGKAGKFLDEERRLSEYPFNDHMGFLELKQKRRVYKTLTLDEKALKTMNSKSQQKKFLDAVHAANVEKVSKMCAKGLDPNFHCQETADPPLCLASGLKSKSIKKLLIALVNGGALLDFRSKKDGATAIHRAVIANNAEALRTLLDLGASPNYKDSKGLTPLYLSVTSSSGSDVDLCEMLLHDHAILGVQDSHGWQEVHQACRNGLIQHLERLLFYAGNMNAQNASGNTPLHVCAVNNQESCARTLLFRGANKEALNFAGQTPYQVAVIANNLELAEIIQEHKPEDVVPYKEAPQFNPRRRVSALSTGSLVSLSRSASDAHSRTGSIYESPLAHSLRQNPASPSPSDRSVPPISSESSVSEASTGSGSGGSNTLGAPCSANGSLLHVPQEEDDKLDSASTLAAALANDPSKVEVLSLSSGVGTGSSGTSNGSGSLQHELVSSSPAPIRPGMHVVCLENYTATEPGALHMSQGDIIEVTALLDDGLHLEGSLRGTAGIFPSSCVQEVKLRNPDGVLRSQQQPPLPVGVMSPVQQQQQQQQRVVGRREMQQQQQPLAPQAIAQDLLGSTNSLIITEPRTCVLTKGRKGFGFVLRGAKAASPLMDMIPSEKCPGLQYMDDVDPGGVADLAGIRKGDFLLKINDEDVSKASHEKVVSLIRKSGDCVRLLVVTVPAVFKQMQPQQQMFFGSGSLTGSPATTVNKQRGYSTLPRKTGGRLSLVPSTASGSSSPAAQPPPPPKRDPSTTLSVGRAKARSMVANMAAIEALDKAIHEHEMQHSSGSSSSKMTAAEVESLILSKTTNGNKDTTNNKSNNAKSKDSGVADPGSSLHKDFSSTPNLKPSTNSPTKAAGNSTPNPAAKSLSQEGVHALDLNGHNTMHHSLMLTSPVNGQRGYGTLPSRKSLQQGSGGDSSSDSGYRTPTLRPPSESGPASLPPPDHPPPPIPVAQLISIESPTKENSDYAQVNNSAKDELNPASGPRSSFKPSDNAKLYASPENVHSVAYRQKAAAGDSPLHSQVPQFSSSSSSPKKKRSPTRANSMPPRPNRPQVLRRSLVAAPAEAPAKSNSEMYHINGVSYTTYTTFRSPITPDECPDEGAFSTRLFDPEMKASPASLEQAGPVDHPLIPEPDYDLSDSEAAAAAAMARGRKKKKSVSFALSDDEDAAEDKTAVKSILKSAKEAMGAVATCHHNVPFESSRRSVSFEDSRQPPVAELGDAKYVQKMMRIPAAKLMTTSLKQVSPQQQPMTQSIVTVQAPPVAQQPQRVRISEGDKIRIAIAPSDVPRTTAPGARSTVSRSNSVAGTTSSRPTMVLASAGSSLQKSQSFSAKKAMSSSTSASSSSSTITENEIQRARSALKPSRSFPNEFPSGPAAAASGSASSAGHEEGDNSSSGVSSDQEVNSLNSTESQQQQQHGNSGKFVTRVPVETTVAAVKKLPSSAAASTISHWDNVSESSDDVSSEKSWILRAEQDPVGRNIISMKQMLHPKLQALFEQPANSQTLPNNLLKSRGQSRLVDFDLGPSSSSAAVKAASSSASSSSTASLLASQCHASQQQSSSHYSSQTLPSRGHLKSGGGGGGAEERSISQSLALIQQHVSSLGEVNSLATGGPPKPRQPLSSSSSASSEAAATAAVTAAVLLAPPPGFSDSEAAMSDSDSMSSSGTTVAELQRKFGGGNAAQQDLKSERQAASLAKQAAHRAKKGMSVMSRSTDDPFSLATPGAPSGLLMSRSVDLTSSKEFQTKPLMGWSKKDVCDWLDSLFLPEYKTTFLSHDVDGLKLASLRKTDLESLGVIRLGHMMSIEKSLKKHLAP